MKKLVFLCVALIATPAMALVTITGVDNGGTPGTLTISYTSDPPEAPRGIALLLSCSDTLRITGYVAGSADDKMNCFIDYAYSNDPYTIDPATQSPLANPAAPGELIPPAEGVDEVSICMGALDQTENQLPGDPEGVIATLTYSGAGDLTIAADTLRGPDSGVVGSEIPSNLSDGPIVIEDVGGGVTECVKDTASFYSDWLAFGSPDCWCYVKNCHGDADGVLGGDPFGGYYSVGAADLAILIGAWKIIEPPQGPGLMATNPGGICADFDRVVGGDPFGGYYRVGAADLGIMIANWKVLEPPQGGGLADCDMTDYNFWIAP